MSILSNSCMEETEQSFIMGENRGRDHLFIINSKSGRGRGRKYREVLSSLAAKDEAIHVEETSTVGELQNVLQTYGKKVGRIYSVGGDGSLSVLISEVMKRGLHSSLEVGVLPAGTGNDYIRNLVRHDFFAKSIEEQIRLMIEGGSRSVDIGKVNEEYFVNVASVGIDADVIGNSMKFKNRKMIPSHLSYLVSAVYTVFHQKKQGSPRLFLDGERVEGEFLLTAVGKGKFYGGGIKVLPEAELSGETFSILKVDKLTKLRILSVIKKFVKGRHGEIPETRFFFGRKVEFVSEEEFAVQYDGEIMFMREVAMQILPQTIKMIVPRERKERGL